MQCLNLSIDLRFTQNFYTVHSLIWMLGSKANNTEIKKAQMRALRIVYNDSGKSLEKLTTIHTKHIQVLMTEVDDRSLCITSI